MKTSECGKSRTPLPRLPELADSVIQFDLAKEIEKAHTKESWGREAGRSSETLVKQGDFRVVLISMKAQTRMGEHRAEGQISIQTLQGRIRIHLRDQKIELPAGRLLALDCGLHHDVESLEESAFLLTISLSKKTPAGSGPSAHTSSEGSLKTKSQE